MTKPMTWLLAGAAFTLCAGVTLAAAADPQDATAAAEQARADAHAAQADAQAWQADAREVRDDARAARDDARRARDDARERARSARDEIRVYRSGDDGDRSVTVIHGGDRAEQLSALLQLRADQQPALKTFLEATGGGRDHPVDHMVRFDRDADGRTTLQRLDEMQARAAEQRADMDRKIAAIKSFYAQLDGPQKKAFDAMPMLMMVGPNIGPMMIPRPMPIVHVVPPVPPVPPLPPVPPRS